MMCVRTGVYLAPVFLQVWYYNFLQKSNCRRIFNSIIVFEGNRYWNSLQDDKTGELYSSKFQFHVIELSKLKSTKGKARKQELYRWAKLISASTWEEVREESEGNHYMEKVRDEMIKMSRDESERYLYLREQMAIRDKASQLRSAENRGRQEGKEEGRKQWEILKLITLVKKKIENGDSIAKIADDLLEDADVIEKIYDIVKENPEKTREEIWDSLMNATMIEM